MPRRISGTRQFEAAILHKKSLIGFTLFDIFEKESRNKDQALVLERELTKSKNQKL